MGVARNADLSSTRLQQGQKAEVQAEDCYRESISHYNVPNDMTGPVWTFPPSAAKYLGALPIKQMTTNRAY